MGPRDAALMEQAGASAAVPVEARKQSPTDLAFQVAPSLSCSEFLASTQLPRHRALSSRLPDSFLYIVL